MGVMRRIRQDESGFSLTELLTAMVIGSVVLWALMTLMTTGFTKSLEVSDRAEAAQAGRTALDRMVTLLDSSICLDPIASIVATPPLIGSSTAPAVVGSGDNYAAFYADLDGVSGLPDKYTLTFDPTARTITEARYASSGTPPNISFATSPTQTRVLATNVVQAVAGGVGVPVFRYYKYGPTGLVDTTPLGTPIAQTIAKDVVSVRIAFQAISSRTKVADGRATTIEGQSTLGLPDTSLPSAGACP